MAFALNIPSVVFDLGAQAERVREQNVGYVLPYALIHATSRLNDKLLDLAKSTSQANLNIKI